MFGEGFLLNCSDLIRKANFSLFSVMQKVETLKMNSENVRNEDCPLVSIVMPMFNSESYVKSSVQSIILQTFSNWELMLVDDCSKDASMRIAEELAESDSRIKLISLDENSGAAVARNAGILAASGRYIAFLDSDDLWAETKLQKQIEFMKREDCALSYTWYECVDECGARSGKVLCPPKKLTYKEMLKSNQIGCLTAMYDTAKVGKVLMPLIRKRQDYGLWLRILKQVEFAYCLSESLAFYRQRTGSISSNKLEMMKHNWSLYRDVERLSVQDSAYYLAWNVIRKVLR